MKTQLLVISSYPIRGKIHGENTVGIASYAKNTLLALKNAAKNQGKDIKITVFAEKIYKNRSDIKSLYKEDGIEIKRVWQRGNLISYIDILKNIIPIKDSENILFEFELSMFGGLLSLLFLPVFLFVLKIYHKKIYFVAHQTVEDIELLSGHTGLVKGSLKSEIIKWLVKAFYFITLNLIDRLIVFEDVFKTKMTKYCHPNKITVIPHGIQNYGGILSKGASKRKLGLGHNYAVLVFGFIAWYKGTDWIIDQFIGKSKSQLKGIKLIVAGGPNPNHKDKKYYTDYIRKIKNRIAKSSGSIIYTGFIDEKDIPVYFSAADVVVLPYRVLMSSSGPLSLAYSFKKPVLISDILKLLYMNKEIKACVRDCDIDQDSILFGLNDNSLFKKIRNFQKHPELAQKFDCLAKKINGVRNFNEIGQAYYRLIQS